MFSSSRTSPSVSPSARASASVPTTSPANWTCWPSCSLRAAATGASEYFGSGPSLGRPRCAVTITLAPPSTSAFNVGTDAVMRPAIGDVAIVVERHIQVGAHQHAAA